jgi:hypothetical protein
MVTIDLSDNTDAGFYSAGHEYQVGVADVTIDTQTVRFWLGTFSIERAGGVLSLIKSRLDVAVSTRLAPTVAARTLDVSTGGEAGIDWGNIGNPLSANNLQSTVISVNQQIASVSGAVGSVTGGVGGNITGGVAYVSGSVGSINTGGITMSSFQNNSISAAALASDAVIEIADGLLDRDMALGVDSGSASARTVRQALRPLRNKWTIASGTYQVTKEDDLTVSWSSVVTGTAGVNPVTGSDPV